MSTTTSPPSRHPKKSAQASRVVGLRHIAEDLGVSISLVSKVLSGRMGTSAVPPERIEAIHRKARELNYQKNFLAQALRTGRQNVIGVCVHHHGTSGSPIVQDLVAGIADQASAYSQRLLLHYYETAAQFHEFCPAVHRNSVDGVIMGGIPHHELLGDLRQMQNRRVPIVTIHDEELDSTIPNIGMDQSQVTRLATLHLIDQGCKRLSHFHVMNNDLNLTHMRFKGFRNALAERGLTYDPALTIEVKDFTHEFGRQATLELIARKKAFDGIVCQSDQLAVGALNVLIAAGRRVPEDVKITGVDDSPFCDFSIVPVTSVSQEFRVRGRMAFETLMKYLNGEIGTCSTRVEPIVHVRASSQRGESTW